MKKLFLFIALFAAVQSHAQILQDANGRPFFQSSYTEYEGSPFLYPNWVDAKVVASNKKVYDNMQVNIDLFEGTPVFFRDGKVYTFTEEIAEIYFQDGTSATPKLFKKGQVINASLPKGYYEVISAEPLFLKGYSRKLAEVPGYDAANKKSRFVEGKTYYATINGQLQKINLTKTDAEKVFGAKWKAISEYATQNKLSFKQQEGWDALMRQYKTL